MKILLAVLVLFLVSCSEGPPGRTSAIRLEIFFRDFDSESWVPYGEKEIERSAPIKVFLSGDDALDLLSRIESLPCAQDPRAKEDRMNLYLLTRVYEGTTLRESFMASKFHMDRSATGDRCLLTDTERSQLTKWLHALESGQEQGSD
jgi:hypothetical protein